MIVRRKIQQEKIQQTAMEGNDELRDDLMDCFSLFDKKGDMMVESSHIIDVLRSVGISPTATSVQKCLRDSDMVGKRVDFETFYGIYHQVANANPLVGFEDMVEGLKTLDRDQTGMISSAELRHVLMNVGDKMTEDQVTRIIAKQEAKDGTVNYKELIQMVMRE